MNRWNIFADNPYIESATVGQIAIHVYNNFDKVIRILTALAKDNKCMICKELSLNYTSSASLANHLQWVHKKRTMEFVRDNIMTKSPSEIEDMLSQ